MEYFRRGRVISLANVYDIDLEKCIHLKEEINAVKYSSKNLLNDVCKKGEN